MIKAILITAIALLTACSNAPRNLHPEGCGIVGNIVEGTSFKVK